MDTRTGEIKEFAPGELIPAGFIPISANEANRLKGRAAKDRTADLKRMRKSAIRDAKCLIGRRLNPAEMEVALETV